MKENTQLIDPELIEEEKANLKMTLASYTLGGASGAQRVYRGYLA